MYFTRASANGCAYSKWELYKLETLIDCCDEDAGVQLDSIRKLQEIASRGHLHANVELCKRYADEEYGRITWQNAAEHCRKV